LYIFFTFHSTYSYTDSTNLTLYRNVRSSDKSIKPHNNIHNR